MKIHLNRLSVADHEEGSVVPIATMTRAMATGLPMEEGIVVVPVEEEKEERVVLLLHKKLGYVAACLVKYSYRVDPSLYKMFIMVPLMLYRVYVVLLGTEVLHATLVVLTMLNLVYTVHKEEG